MTSLPYFTPEAQAHGTRGRYVTGCRCGDCTAANLRAYHVREARSREAIAGLARAPGSICPGWDGEPCPKQRKLRSDSAGGCAHCRARAGGNPLVDAKPARQHIRALSRRGICYRTLADAAKVNATTVLEVSRGRKQRIRRSTLESILSVDEGAIADHALVPAGETRRMLRDLEAEYLGKRRVSEALGYGSYFRPGNYARKVTARNAQRVRRLHERVTG